MSRFRRVLAHALLVPLAACDPELDVPPRPEPAPLEEHLSGDSVVISPRTLRRIDRWLCDLDTLTVDSTVALALHGDDTLEREIHDCQRMIVRGEFGPLVGVFPYAPSMSLDNDDFAVWTIVAMVYNWGWRDGRTDAYGPLAVEPRSLYCLLLLNRNQKWYGAMAPAEHGCIPHSGVALHVTAQDYAGPDNVDRALVFPPTARFRWHQRAEAYAIGVKCGTQWCTVGTQGATAGLPALSGHVLGVVPGYFDEQPLAVYIAAKDTLVPGPMGRIYPSSQLARWNGPTATPDWAAMREYASIRIQSANVDAALFDAYVQKFGLTVSPDGRMASADLFFAPAAAGGAVAELRTGTSAKPASLVALVENQHHSAPGTVRWRWLDQDEAAWVPCQGNNCCTASF